MSEIGGVTFVQDSKLINEVSYSRKRGNRATSKFYKTWE